MGDPEEPTFSLWAPVSSAKEAVCIEDLEGPFGLKGLKEVSLEDFLLLLVAAASHPLVSSQLFLPLPTQPCFRARLCTGWALAWAPEC